MNIPHALAIFNPAYILIPVALPLRQRREGRLGTVITSRVLYVFGVRVAYWTVV